MNALPAAIPRYGAEKPGKNMGDVLFLSLLRSGSCGVNLFMILRCAVLRVKHVHFCCQKEKTAEGWNGIITGKRLRLF